MATAEYKATVGAVRASAAPANLIGATFSKAATLDTDADAAVTAATLVGTDLTTAFTDYNTFAAALLAITGDTFNTGTHQFTFGGATGLTHAQWATLGAQLNTALTDFVTAQTAATASTTAVTLVQTDSDALQTAIAAVTADISLYIGNVANVADLNILHDALNAIRRVIAGSNLLAVGSGTPRSP